MISADLAGRTRAAIERLGRSSLDSEAFRREAIGRLQRTIPFAGWYWSVDDPATLFPAWTLAEGPPLGNQHIGERFWRRFWDIEEQEPVARKLAILRRGPRHVGTLRQATGGELGRSRRWEELLRPFGMGDELHAALVLGDVCWGSLGLYRERAEGPFTPEEGALVQDLVVPLATGLRATLLNTPPAIQDVRDGPSLLLLGPDLSVVATTPTAERWLARLGGSSATLPPIVFALAARLRALEEGRAPADLAPRARIRTVDGSWLVMHAARLSGSRSGDIAIMIESAGPGDLAPILVHGYGLSPREQEVVQHVLRGASTAQIAAALCISPYTVQDHFKTIFDKVGVRSRRELASALAARPPSFTIRADARASV
jgi:DNA-binding CsgD family transcriptional regulator